MAILESNTFNTGAKVGSAPGVAGTVPVVGGTSPTTPGATTPDPADVHAPQPGVTTFKLDGMHKSIAGPVTGFTLHQLAGFPDKLVTAGGEEVHMKHEPFKMDAETEFVTKHHMSGAQGFNPEHKLADEGPKVDPPHSMTVTGAKAEEPTVKVQQK